VSKSRDAPVAPLDDPVVGFLVVRDRPGRWCLFGELDAFEVARLRAGIGDADGDAELDCAGLTFIDAAGLRLFVELSAGCRARGAKLRIINPSHCVVRLLKLSDLGTELIDEPVGEVR
jgi:anti-anti-sigma factor